MSAESILSSVRFASFTHSSARARYPAGLTGISCPLTCRFKAHIWRSDDAIRNSTYIPAVSVAQQVAVRREFGFVVTKSGTVLYRGPFGDSRRIVRDIERAWT